MRAGQRKELWGSEKDSGLAGSGSYEKGSYASGYREPVWGYTGHAGSCQTQPEAVENVRASGPWGMPVGLW